MSLFRRPPADSVGRNGERLAARPPVTVGGDPNIRSANTLGFLASLRRVVLSALAVALLLLMAAVVAGIAIWNDHLAERDALERGQDMAAAWERQIRDETRVLAATAAALAGDGALRDLIRAGDRAGIQRVAGDLIQRLNRQALVSQVSFIAPDRRVILRLHAPGQAGDEVFRRTLLAAVRSGQPEAGLEAEPSGHFTLRLVQPWLWEGQGIGYLDLATEVGEIVSRLNFLQRTEAVLFLRKSVLARDRWQPDPGPWAAMQEWDHFGELVLAASPGLPAELVDRLGRSLVDNVPATLRSGKQVLLTYPQPVTDIDGRPVAILVTTADHSETQATAMQTTINLVMVTLVIGSVVFLVFWGVLDRFEMVYVSSERERRRFESLSMRDGLTDVYNRRAFDLILEQQRALAVLTRTPVSILMLDVDRFKVVNDRYGHPVGDTVLVHVAHMIRRTLRTTDTVARYGGEEFAVIMPGVVLGEARQVAERIRLTIANQAVLVPGAEPPHLQVTVSIGVATLIDPAGELTHLLACADQALYRAKQDGRNRVVEAA